MAAQLRATIYGSPLANFRPGYPSKGEVMRHYIWCLEEEKRVQQIEKLNETVRRTIKDKFVKSLRTHWSNQPESKPILDKEQVKKKVQPLIDDYKDLENKKCKMATMGFENFIDEAKKKLLPLFDIEAKPKVTKKRSIQEVRNYQDSKCVTNCRRQTKIRTL